MGLKDKLIKLKVTGPCVGHNRFLNLRNIERLVKKDPYATFGINNLGSLHPSEVLQSIASITGCSADIKLIEGTGFIKPEASARGLKEAAAILSSLKKDSKVLMATGHPGSLIGFYLEVGRFLRNRCQLLTTDEQIEVNRFRCPDCGTHDDIHWIDFIEEVAFVTDGDVGLHVHSPEPMAKLIDAVGIPDLVLADHGFVGEAVNRKIPAFTFMDTNDPVLAVAKARGDNITIIPMDDNRGNAVSAKVGKLLVDIINERSKG